MKFQKGKCNVLVLGRNSAMHQCKWGAKQEDSSSPEKDLEVLVDTTLNHKPATCPCSKEGKEPPGLH